MTPETLRTRLATPADAAAIAAIYNEGIADRIATFETEPRTSEQLATQLIEKGDRFPTVVVEREGQIVAWGGAGAYRSRPAYSGVAEHSVYEPGMQPPGLNLLSRNPGSHQVPSEVRTAPGTALTIRPHRPPTRHALSRGQ